MTHIGVLTAGGDCPGLNAAIRGVVARAIAGGAQVTGVADGWAGLMDGLVRPLGQDDVRGILTRGGTILGTSRTDPYEHGRRSQDHRQRHRGKTCHSASTPRSRS